MTTETRQAIAEMRKRGSSGEEIINLAMTLGEWTDTAPALALVRHVANTPNYRKCGNCYGAHNVQQCPEIRAAMAGASNGFLGRFKGDTHDEQE